jgi:5'-deoxynucleotidase YfbR-like HD superfamily hydrolase
MDRLAAVREAGRIERLHTIPHHQRYTVGHHTWTMLVLLHELFPEPGPSKRLMWAITFHDVPERWVGDVPTTIKWSSAELLAALDAVETEINERFGFQYKLNPQERNWLKALDLLELFLFCEDELAMGNQHVQQVRNNCFAILSKNTEVPIEVRRFVTSYKWKREDNIWRSE